MADTPTNNAIAELRAELKKLKGRVFALEQKATVEVVIEEKHED